MTISSNTINWSKQPTTDPRRTNHLNLSRIEHAGGAVVLPKNDIGEPGPAVPDGVGNVIVSDPPQSRRDVRLSTFGDFGFGFW